MLIQTLTTQTDRRTTEHCTQPPVKHEIRKQLQPEQQAGIHTEGEDGKDK